MGGELKGGTRLLGGSPNQGAMDRGVGLWKILAWTGLLLAGALYMVEPLELFSYFAAPACLLAAEHVGPGLFVENKANGATVHRNASATTDEEAAQLFEGAISEQRGAQSSARHTPRRN
jgi:hypothetical protein